MKRYCKHIDITNRKFVRTAVWACIRKKLSRRDVIEMMSDYSRLPKEFLKQVIRDGHREFLNGIIETIVDALITEIRTGRVNFKPIWYIKNGMQAVERSE